MLKNVLNRHVSLSENYYTIFKKSMKTSIGDIIHTETLYMNVNFLYFQNHPLFHGHIFEAWVF